MNLPKAALTSADIQALLAAISNKETLAGPQFQRLIEIYCVLKVGGVQVQTAAAQAYHKREQDRLEAKLAGIQADSPERASLQQELTDLRRAVSWRLSFLQSIHPAEEQAVAQHLSQIEQGLQRSR
jgi:hypothetical protein